MSSAFAPRLCCEVVLFMQLSQSGQARHVLDPWQSFDAFDASVWNVLTSISQRHHGTVLDEEEVYSLTAESLRIQTETMCTGASMVAWPT